MKKFIVTTTINPPTEAIQAFDAMPGWTLVVVGDRKTPADYKLKNGVYLSPQEQEELSKPLSDAIGWNCIQRRNMGFLYAYRAGADLMATVDDDNIPLPGWGENLLIGQDLPVWIKEYQISQPVFDPISVTNYPHLWHRGFPLQLLADRNPFPDFTTKEVRFDVQADFWNGDPDVDAICRMEHNPKCEFDPGCFPFCANKPSPFNSQNTFLTREALRHYFMFPWVGRYDDIFGSYHVQHQGFRVVYNKASVIQKRNPHDPMKDFEREMLGQLDCLDTAINPIKTETHALDIYRDLMK